MNRYMVITSNAYYKYYIMDLETKDRTNGTDSLWKAKQIVNRLNKQSNVFYSSQKQSEYDKYKKELAAL